MKREIRTTSDGSTTIFLPDWNEQYHSKHGAIAEAKHVFIKHGLQAILKKEISILEIGFGTGLNCFLTYLEAKKTDLKIDYIGLEAYPITDDEFDKMNYISALDVEKDRQIYETMHTISWEESHQLSANFNLTKRNQLFENMTDLNRFNLIYFDAFGPEHQPELWTAFLLKKMYLALKFGGILTTYSAKGSVRRTLQAIGFAVERLPGPPGKREMLRATKNK